VSRITPGTMIVAIFAILLGLVGAYAVRRHLNPPVVEVVAETARRVPLASGDVEAGRALTLSDVMLVPMTTAQLKQKGITSEYMSNPDQIIGRVLRQPLTKGGVFITSNMYPEGMGPDISDRLKPGLRAVTVGIEGTGIVGGLARPGALADVLFRVTADPKSDIPEKTITLLEKVQVLAVGGNTVMGKANAGEPKTVTLAVNPAQANALKVAEGRGLFSLSLRSETDESVAQGSVLPSTLENVLALEPKVSFTTEIYRAGMIQKMTFEGEELVSQEFFDAPVAGRERSQVPGQLVKQVEPQVTAQPQITAQPQVAAQP
jgi:Flp pilus assembly protein CpaB